MRILILMFFYLTLSCKYRPVEVENKVKADNNILNIYENDTVPLFNLFGKLINKDDKGTFRLFNNYSFSIRKQKDSLYILDFEKCKPFVDREKMEQYFQLKDSSYWQEYLLKHNHYFYVKNDSIIVLDLIGGNLKNNECNYKNSMTIDVIRVYSQKDYIKSLNKKRNTPYLLQSLINGNTTNGNGTHRSGSN